MRRLQVINYRLRLVTRQQMSRLVPAAGGRKPGLRMREEKCGSRNITFKF